MLSRMLINQTCLRLPRLLFPSSGNTVRTHSSVSGHEKNPGQTMLRCAEIVDAGKPLALVSRPVPVAPEVGGIVRTTYAGVCHSDVHFLDDEQDVGGGRINRNRDKKGVPYRGVVMGHEILGVLDSFGPKAEPEKYGLSLGDTVLVYPWIGCGECSNCLAGHNNLCDVTCSTGYGDIGLTDRYMGGYSTHVVVPDLKFAIKLPKGIPHDIACLLPCSGLTAYCALKKIAESVERAKEIRGTPRLLIVGVGGLGLWCLKLAKIMYPGIHVACVDMNSRKLDIARHAGSDSEYVYDPLMSSPDIVKLITDKKKNKNDAVIDFVGSGTTLTQGLHSIHTGGVVVGIGIVGGQLSIPALMLIGKSPSIRGSRVGRVADLKELVALLCNNDVTYPATESYTLDEVNTALNKLRDGNVDGRAIISVDPHYKGNL